MDEKRKIPMQIIDIDDKNSSGYMPFSGKELYLGCSETEDALIAAKAIGRGLITKFNAEKVVLFGSIASNKMTKKSDIDIAVWGIPDNIFYKAAAYADGYSGKWTVDLVDFKDCSKAVRTSILREGISINL